MHFPNFYFISCLCFFHACLFFYFIISNFYECIDAKIFSTMTPNLFSAPVQRLGQLFSRSYPRKRAPESRQQQPRPPISRTGLLAQPPELVWMITDCLDGAPAISLSLTCRTFYYAFCFCFPNPAGLRSRSRGVLL